MTFSEITKRIKQELHVGGNLAEGYIKLLHEVYKGDKRAIEDFHSRYNENGDGVIFSITVAGVAREFEVELAKNRTKY